MDERTRRNLAIREWQDRIKVMARIELKALSKKLTERDEREATRTIHRATHAALVLHDIPKMRDDLEEAESETVDEALDRLHAMVDELADALVELGENPADY